MLEEFLEDFGKKQILHIVFSIIFVFIFSFFKSCKELRYTISGKTTEGTVTGVAEGATGRRSKGIFVFFDYKNENTDKRQSGSTRIHKDDAEYFHKQQKITIEYYGKKHYNSRVKGIESNLWLIIFFTFLGIIILSPFCLVIYHKLQKKHRTETYQKSKGRIR